MTVYGDLLFLINFSMDFLCFYICSSLLRRRLPLMRACIASVLGGVYSVTALFFDAGGAALILDVGFCLLMCGTVFFKKGVGFFEVIKASAVYFFVSMLLGGAMTALYALLNRTQLFSGELDEGGSVSVWMFGLLAIASGGISALGGRFFRASKQREDVILEMSDGKNSVSLRALCDSGNLASDPISARSVVIATVDSSRNIIPKELYPVFEDVSNIEKIPVGLAAAVRLIPSGTVAGDSLLPAIKLKSIKIKNGKREKEVDALVAFVKRDGFSGYDAIIPNDIMI